MNTQYNPVKINVVREILFSAMFDTRIPISKTKEIIEDALDVYLNRDISHYHNFDHIYDVVMYMFEKNEGNLNGRQNSLIAALFHDIIYIPGQYDNEHLSAEYAKTQLLKAGYYINNIQNIENIIEATKYPLHNFHDNFDMDYLPLIRADLNGLLNDDKYRESTLKVYWETKAYFPNLDDNEFARRRIAFFEELFKDGYYNKITAVFKPKEILTIKKNIGIK